MAKTASKYRLKDIDGFGKAVLKSNKRKRRGIQKGLSRIRKNRNVGRVNNFNWDKRM